jgi:GTP pyrophosphokinase
VANRDELLYALGSGKVLLDDSTLDFLRGKKSKKDWRSIFSFGKKKSEVQKLTGDEDFVKNLNKKKTLLLDEETIAKCQIASCCKPIPGDNVMGYISADGTLEIHKRSCPEATKNKTRYGNNILDARWDTHRVMFFDTSIYIKGVDSQGVLYAIADVLHKQTQYLIKRITLETNDGIFEGSIDFSVFDNEDVKILCQQLKQIENVTKAVRIDLNGK